MLSPLFCLHPFTRKDTTAFRLGRRPRTPARRKQITSIAAVSATATATISGVYGIIAEKIPVCPLIITLNVVVSGIPNTTPFSDGFRFPGRQGSDRFATFKLQTGNAVALQIRTTAKIKQSVNFGLWKAGSLFIAKRVRVKK